MWLQSAGLPQGTPKFLRCQETEFQDLPPGPVTADSRVAVWGQEAETAFPCPSDPQPGHPLGHTPHLCTGQRGPRGHSETTP